MKFFNNLLANCLLGAIFSCAGNIDTDVINCLLIFRDLVPTVTLTENLATFFNHIENNNDFTDDTLILIVINDALKLLDEQQEVTDKKVYPVIKNMLEQLKDRLMIETVGLSTSKQVSAAAYVWTTLPATIPVQTNPPNGAAAITFTNGITFGGITFNPNNGQGQNVNLPSAGFYSVTWSVSGGSSGTSTDNAFGVYFNNLLQAGSYYETIIPGTVYPTNGQLIFQTTGAGVLTLQNVLANFQGVLTTSGNVSANNLATGSPSNNVTASMQVIKLS